MRNISAAWLNVGAGYAPETGLGELTATPVRAYLAGIAGLAPSTRKRKRAAVASFCRWAVRHDPPGRQPGL